MIEFFSKILSKKYDIRLKAGPSANKTLLRAYNGLQIGTTAFFRNRPLLDTLFKRISADNNNNINVLFHACSIGAEPYSFAIQAYLYGIKNVKITATDINSEFIRYAKRGEYDASILDKLTDAEKTFFKTSGKDKVRISRKIRDLVSFIDPISFVDANFDQSFDLVFVMNALTYVSEEEQAQTIDKIARYNNDYLILTAFHPDSIRDDLVRNHYNPVIDNMKEIYDGWEERKTTDDKLVKGLPQYSYGIGTFGNTPDPEFQHCAIFKKSQQTMTG